MHERAAGSMQYSLLAGRSSHVVHVHAAIRRRGLEALARTFLPVQVLPEACCVSGHDQRQAALLDGHAQQPDGVAAGRRHARQQAHLSLQGQPRRLGPAQGQQLHSHLRVRGEEQA